MRIKIDRDDIQGFVSIKTYKKGLSYFNSKMILDYRIEESLGKERGVFINSQVKGSQQFNYAQTINISEDMYGDISISGDCSCYVGYNCKHIVAVVLDYENRGRSLSYKVPENKILNRVNNWIDGVIFDGENRVKDIPTSFMFQYRLKKGFNLKGFEIKATKIKALKKGGFGKPADVSIDHLVRKKELPNFITAEDEEILAILTNSMLSSSNSYYGSSLELGGKLGAIVLNKMLETGRLYLEDDEIPLKEGLPKNVKIDWKKFDDNYKLNLFIDKSSELIQTTPPFYVDTENLTIGKALNLNLSEDEYYSLISLAPTISENMVEIVAETLMERMPSLPPLISKNQKHKKIISKPKPHLILSSDGINEYIDMSFNYEGNIVKTSEKNNTFSKKIDNEVVTVFRDLESETELLKQIEDLGFSDNLEKGIFVNPVDSSITKSVERWRDFKDKQIPTLEIEGWSVDIDPSFNYDFENIEDVEININENNNWFEIAMSVYIEGKKVSLLPMVTEFLTQVEDIHNLDEKINIPYENGKFIRISSKVMKPIIDTIIELYDGKSDKIEIGSFEAHTVEIFENSENMILTGSSRLLELAKKLKNFKGLENIEPPKGLKAELRDYQKIGLNWLNFLREYGFNGVLADDMGLGKTVQTLSFIQRENEFGRLKKPILVVVPTSLLGNWRRESEKFTPDLKVLTLHGDKRKSYFDKLDEYDLVLTTYGLVARDFEKLSKIDFYYLILDEAQKIKNPQAKVSQYLRQLKSENRLALTGTPMENHLGELWSIFTFLMPGFLGKLDKFNKNFRKPIEKNHDEEIQKRLKNRIEPFMLRRKKDEVVKELPKKTVIIQSVTFNKKQAQLYETIRITMEKKVQDAIQEKGLGSSQIMILDALLKLRQVCCDPSLVKLESAKTVKESAKLDALLNLVEELVAEGRKILLFSQFTTMLSIIEKRVEKMKISYTKLTGSTRDRDSVIETFKSGNADLFLISLKAGGVGLNLTEADVVIHYDPWWNPAVEEQATDRAYRIGQDKPVFVYKLIAEKTVEEKILELQDRKRALANIMIDNSKEKFELTQDDINDLFSPIL